MVTGGGPGWRPGLSMSGGGRSGVSKFGGGQASTVDEWPSWVELVTWTMVARVGTLPRSLPPSWLTHQLGRRCCVLPTPSSEGRQNQSTLGLRADSVGESARRPFRFNTRPRDSLTSELVHMHQRACDVAVTTAAVTTISATDKSKVVCAMVAFGNAIIEADVSCLTP